jgi:hypothetical protein
MADISRRSFLTAAAATAGALLAKPALAASEKVLGYTIVGPEKYPEVAAPGDPYNPNPYFANSELFNDLRQNLKSDNQYRGFVEQVRQLYGRFPAAQTGQTILMKAAAVQYWVNQHFHYTPHPHNTAFDAPIFDLNGRRMETIHMHVFDRWGLPDTVLKRGGAANCIDYAIADLIGLRALGVPPEDILLAGGHYTTDPDQLRSATQTEGPLNHAWTMVRDRASGQWVVLYGFDPGNPVLIKTNTGTLKDIAKIGERPVTVYQIPVMGMNGNGKIIYLDSMDDARNFKIAPAADYTVMPINITGDMPDNAPMATPRKPKAPATQGQPQSLVRPPLPR